MNFDDTPQEAEFRSLARQWVDAHAPKELEPELSKSSLGRIRLQNKDIVEVGKTWQKKKAEGGWACLHWPKEYGGRGATPIEKVIWQQEEGVYGKLTQPFQIGEGMCGPTVMAFRRKGREPGAHVVPLGMARHAQALAPALGRVERVGPVFQLESGVPGFARRMVFLRRDHRRAQHVAAGFRNRNTRRTP